jgi:hypothetical protein
MKKPTVSKLKKRLDSIFSIYIRNKYADFSGYVMCVTCKTTKPINEMQNGHYVSRSSSILRYSEDNCFPQCVACNIFKKGNYPAYTEYLLKHFGQNYILNLVKVGRLEKKWTIKELQELIIKYGNSH